MNILKDTIHPAGSTYSLSAPIVSSVPQRSHLGKLSKILIRILRLWIATPTGCEIAARRIHGRSIKEEHLARVIIRKK